MEMLLLRGSFCVEQSKLGYWLVPRRIEIIWDVRSFLRLAGSHDRHLGVRVALARSIGVLETGRAHHPHLAFGRRNFGHQLLEVCMKLGVGNALQAGWETDHDVLKALGCNVIVGSGGSADS